ncbi:NIPSNAP family protein [Pyrenophora tritici-repentis]|uniref:NIPSNAP family protein n=2 Tax=Pyrenophora tritici-repentis TaxID=45151 RepID=A0A2W1F6W7_9PLEO|nr:NIPSNAP family protein [Pyrenophora tritici-repentis Pt-1C-BFP]KAA8614927.1 NIPSNAP family protein [Pyrenophora tritici-repentis]EDU50260.1 NIPSNAP family protein [Pyrenophora tritici-repentis Pt-1C-BFP]KAF7444751.1 NIPSNAP family protein [Pyrenophora tritici-repentis]KAF7564588.1 NIPSNAP family protein [Pyrenophora tritici-repentis]KAG9378991.1 NIPSNAP family protein [Pyrenophora tritici-repentis]
MLTRRACAGVRGILAPQPAIAFRSRAFGAAAVTQSPARAPAIADITPDSAASFNEKQKSFRDGLVAAQKRKEQEEKEARAREEENSKKKGGALSSLIYGTPEGRELDKDIERSFSQVLARGKYVHSIVFHTVKPDKVDEYTELVGNWYSKMVSIPENKVHLVGSWKTEVGDCNTFVHIWEYQRYEGYHESLHNIQSHPEFPAFDAKLKTLISSKHTSLMQEFSFWPTTPPRQLGGIFELRSYTLHPGNLLEWETHWRRGLKARREVMEGVGAWFVQIGDLNTVHHLWQFANLEERRIRREQSWSVEGWGETVHKTVPLIQTMKSRILMPCSWSTVA